MINVIITLLIVGAVLWFINAKTPISAGWKKAINVVAIICVGVWLLNLLGVFDFIRAHDVPVPKLK